LKDTSWKESLQAFLQLDKWIVSGGKWILGSELDCLQWHCLLRDFSSVLQLVNVYYYFFNKKSTPYVFSGRISMNVLELPIAVKRKLDLGQA
jgi:hypothetical protein